MWSGEQRMKVTFFIGNGFDLRIGMKTRYKDMYDSYIELYSEDEDINLFKQELKKDKPNEYTNWSDFEEKMGKLAPTFRDEMHFIKCVRDFRKYMVSYLEAEEKWFGEYISSQDGYTFACSNVMGHAIDNFYLGQTPNAISRIRVEEKGKIRESNFISFNYTRAFDFLLNEYQKRTKIFFEDAPIHIHGKLGENVLLGVDNISQLGDTKYSISKKMERAFVKTAFNEEYDIERVKKAKRIITESDVICIYGMLLGITDKTWIDEVAAWLLSDLKHQLVYFQYSERKFANWEMDEKMDEEDERKNKLLNRLYFNEEDIRKVYNNVHIPVGFDLFDMQKELEDIKMRLKRTPGSMK